MPVIFNVEKLLFISLKTTCTEVGKFELYSQIKEFNEDLAVGKTMMNNVWVGCLFPDYYENIDYIPFEIASDSNEPTV